MAVYQTVLPKVEMSRTSSQSTLVPEARPACLLCHSGQVSSFCICDDKSYWRCGRCHLTFVDVAERLTTQSEHTHYLSHENKIDDQGYRRFLSRLAVPLLERLHIGASGLDYGCGPGPALAHMLRESGHQCAVYDPFFAHDPAVLTKTYDFITCTEVAEHFHDPAAEFDRLDRLLRPGGSLGLMTCFQTDDAKFAKWHYRKDPTHVVFYKRETLAFVADRKGWKFDCPVKDIAIMQKPEVGNPSEQ